MFTGPVVVDGRNHLLGRLASVIAKELLAGQHVIVVRCEEVNVTGKPIRNQFKYLAYLRKRHATNPTRGQFHYRAPSRMVWRAVRGMLPIKSDKGNAALDRLKCFDGVPTPYDTMKRQVVPEALRHLRLAPQRKFTVLRQIANYVGWKNDEIISRLEEKRKLKSQSWFEVQKTLAGLRNQARAQAMESLDSSLKNIIQQTA
ncbi:hypothetical protein RCL1_004182 [Eukaryota sp. TZLM3-RCL]